MISTLLLLHERNGGSLLDYTGQVTKDFRKKYQLNQIGDKQPGDLKHLSANQLKLVVGESFDSYFKFSIVRNPWARILSRFHFHHIDYAPDIDNNSNKLFGTPRKTHQMQFDKWLERRWKKWKRHKNIYRSQLSKLVDQNNNMLVDYVGKLESFQESFDFICLELSVDTITTVHENPTKKVHYSEIYNERTKSIVYEMCYDDIEYFNYKFEESA